MRLSEEEKRELLELAASSTMREDGRLLRAYTREKNLLFDGKVDPLRFLQMLSDFNALLNHPLKKNRPFIERIMKL